MSDGTVSVIIPAYNAGVFLRACIDSVLQQTRPALEVIVINDGSSDDTAAVAASYGDRIRFVSQPNGGVSRARNRGSTWRGAISWPSSIRTTSGCRASWSFNCRIRARAGTRHPLRAHGGV